MSDNFDDELKRVRINNVFCKANKTAKSDFLKLWNKFLTLLTEENSYSVLGYVNSMSIQVVSDEYVLFSTDITSDSVIFNNNLESIEMEFSRLMKQMYKFISVNTQEWESEKKNFIKNKDKTWTLIDENTLKKDDINSLESSAKDIFGDIIEIN